MWRCQQCSMRSLCCRPHSHPGMAVSPAGMLSILFLTPLWGFLALAIPFQPEEFSLGLAVMACVPTSLSSGVTLVSLAWPCSGLRGLAQTGRPRRRLPATPACMQHWQLKLWPSMALASQVIQGYGNGALGLLFTVASNIVGIVTAPLMIKMVFAGTVDPGAIQDAAFSGPCQLGRSAASNRGVPGHVHRQQGRCLHGSRRSARCLRRPPHACCRH